jgi:hypothetical protein
MDFVHPVEALIPGVQGRVLAVLAATTAELNLRTIARLSGVSSAQASRVLPVLVQVGLVERREVPPASLFRLVLDHVAAGPLLSLVRSQESMVETMIRVSASMESPPASVIVFGSFARGEADADSDVDVVHVRPAHIDEDDSAWSDSVQQWKDDVARASGNRVEGLEVGADQVGDLLASGRGLWTDVAHDGLVVGGVGLTELAASNRG